ncbi:MAG: cysteine hydrolase [Caldilineales bacterium]|nr:cysteine hydrolase [Caldilineales bacterium]
MSNVVLVVDMQNGFVDPKGTLYVGETARAIIPKIRNLVEAEKARGSTIIFTADTHDPDDLEFRMWPPHCVRGTWENEIIPELADLAAEATIQRKRRYSAFFETDLAERLQALQPEHVLVTGVCTDICVMHTAADLRNRDYEVVVVGDAVATFDPQAHEFALRHMEKILGAQVVSSYESWQKEPAHATAP